MENMNRNYKVVLGAATIMSSMTARDAARLAKKTGGVRVKSAPTANAAPAAYGCGAMGW